MTKDLFLPQAELTRVRRLLVAAAERGEAGTALLERSKTEGGPESTPLDPQQLEKELLLAREAVTCKYQRFIYTNITNLKSLFG